MDAEGAAVRAAVVVDVQGLPPTCGTLPESQEAVYNFQLLPRRRMNDARSLRCVMCGSSGTRDSAEASAEIVLFVKRGRSTTCDGCMCLTYRLRDTTDGYFKWCEYCHKFKSLSAFAGKVDSVTCDCCRKEKNAGWSRRKRKRTADGDEADADAPTA